ncbi:MAG: MBOAT family O-acyltransferase [Ferruginibacter sp.]
MLFNSFEFLLFFPIVTFLYYITPGHIRWITLLIASCIFYGFFIPSYLFILLTIILIDYTAGIKIENTYHKKTWLVISICANVLLLSVFKYYNFFIENFNGLTGSHFILLNIILPIGLSFHTFQSISYTIEVYRGKQKAVRHLGYYALYVMFYPQLVAGPIERPQHLFPQLYAKHNFAWNNIFEGIRLMIWGLVKKIVIADRLGDFVEGVFNRPSDVSCGSIWLALLFFGIQIYADFSGYSDIALGCAKCLGIELKINFNRPYLSKNIKEFWQRWHISLSQWFRDYLYIPLGGNKRGDLRKQLNILLTFCISGFWHGAGWTFIIWGLLHGFYMVVYNCLKKYFDKINIGKYIGWVITMCCVFFGWIFFRAPSLHHAIDFIRSGLQVQNFSWQSILNVPVTYMTYGRTTLIIILFTSSYMFVFEKYSLPRLINLNKYFARDIFLINFNILLFIFLGIFHKTSFIYFQF